jgi:hypothetical protein
MHRFIRSRNPGGDPPRRSRPMVHVGQPERQKGAPQRFRKSVIWTCESNRRMLARRTAERLAAAQGRAEMKPDYGFVMAVAHDDYLDLRRAGRDDQHGDTGRCLILFKYELRCDVCGLRIWQPHLAGGRTYCRRCCTACTRLGEIDRGMLTVESRVQFPILGDGFNDLAIARLQQRARLRRARAWLDAERDQPPPGGRPG